MNQQQRIAIKEQVKTDIRAAFEGATAPTIEDALRWIRLLDSMWPGQNYAVSDEGEDEKA